MKTESAHSLLDEWRWRRERLSRQLEDVFQFAGEQIRVLDFLIRSYGESPEAQKPAPARPDIDFRVNQRAIVVLHHVWEGKVGGVKTAGEAKDRMSAILQRIVSHGREAACDPMDESVFSTEEEPDIDPVVWARVSGWLHWHLPVGSTQIADALGKNRAFPHSVASHLYQRIMKTGHDDVQAARLLIQGVSRAAYISVVCAWRDLIVSGRKNEAWAVLHQFLMTPEPPTAIAVGVREALANDSSRVRLAALEILEKIGTLNDIGLLSDLLALPLATDELPDERPAVLRTMQRIAETAKRE